MRTLILFVTFLFSVNAEYSEQVAMERWRLNALSYCSQQSLSNLTCTECIQFRSILSEATVLSEPSLSLYGFVGLWKGKDLMIVFRASEDDINLIENLSSPILAPFPVCGNCMASLTYILMYATVRTRLLSIVLEKLKQHPNAKIHTTGHSLGGVFASFVAIDLCVNVEHYDYDEFLASPQSYALFRGLTNVEQVYQTRTPVSRCEKVAHSIEIASVYTFGMPRIGNEALATLIHKRIPNFYRVTHGRDLVPLLPPREFDFAHTGDEYWYRKESSLTRCHFPESEYCINSVNDPVIDDHSQFLGERKGHCSQ